MSGPAGAAGWRAFALRGADRDDALAFLHVHADVQGTLEEHDAHVVWLVGRMPALPAGLAVELEERAVADEHFTITGLERDTAIAVADDLLVRPPWVERPAGFSGVELVVPRGGAFGSGEHGSTQAALLLLHRTWRGPASLADVGCGSGVLALYAQQRGVARLEACDIDGPSVLAARELLPTARVEHGGPERLAGCEQVVANMTGTELGASLAAILDLWHGPAPLVLSGMRGHEVDGLVERVGRPEVDRTTVGEFTAVAFAADGGPGAQAVR
ncbi:MAG: 50S ribosomal protein L11 methyltransferase [Planctomycetota bacterium]